MNLISSSWRQSSGRIQFTVARMLEQSGPHRTVEVVPLGRSEIDT